jgi:hypothetical protein
MLLVSPLPPNQAEQLVWRYQQQCGVPAAIVRPSLVCAVAYEPIPGYVGNWAGPIGASGQRMSYVAGQLNASRQCSFAVACLHDSAY